MQTNTSEIKIESALAGAMRTLLLPLWARAIDSKNNDFILRDHQAELIIADLCKTQKFADDFKEMEQIFDEYLQLSQVFRAKMIEDEVKSFLMKNPEATIVNLGAGLDTTFNRVDNGSVTWYDLDFPEVIAIRNQYIPETTRSKCIAKSIMDFSWLDEIGDGENGLMFISCGVFFFLTEYQARQLFLEFADRFPGSELIFDGMSPLFMRLANRIVLKKSSMGSQAVMVWATPSDKKLTQWDNRFVVVDKYPLYSKVKLNANWGLSTLFRMKMVNFLQGINIYHMKFKR